MKRTRILAVVLTVVMLLAVMPFSAVSAAGNVWDGSVATEIALGSGTEDDPYIITDGAELLYLDTIDTAGLYFELGNDIVLNDTSAANWFETANDWYYIEFYGNLDGNGYTISGLCVNPETVTSDYNDVGLFGYTYGATIANVNIEDAYIVGSGDIGGIAGEANCSYIYNCSFDGIIKAYMYEYLDSDNVQYYGGSYAAGIVGYAYGAEGNECYIEACTNNGDIYTESYNAAGIAGGIEDYTYIIDCVNNGNISGESYSGGIVGEIWGDYTIDDIAYQTTYSYGYVGNCVNNGKVIGNSEDSYFIGGIAGYATVAEIAYCSNFGEVSAYENVGGIVGYLACVGEMYYCVNYAEISGIYGVGGIIGEQYGEVYVYSEDVEEVRYWGVAACVNHGDVIGIDDEDNGIYSYSIGGIVGKATYGQYIAVYNYGDISGYETVGGIAGKIADSSYFVSAYNGGKVIAVYEYAGGIAGEVVAETEDVYIYGCTNNGYVYCEFDVGGIIGCGDWSDYYINIYESQNKGTVEGICCVGGIAGFVAFGTIEDCLNDGLIIINEDVNDYWGESYGGGIIGEANEVNLVNCVNTGDVDDSKAGYFGGIVGDYFGAITLTNCYYLETVADFGVAADYTGENAIIYTEEYEGANSITASEMKDEATFADFDFEDTWSMGSEYPELIYVAKSILGDVNFDGVVDKKDYALVKRACFGTAELDVDQTLAADVNGDGIVDKKDYTLIKRACFGTAEIK